MDKENGTESCTRGRPRRAGAPMRTLRALALVLAAAAVMCGMLIGGRAQAYAAYATPEVGKINVGYNGSEYVFSWATSSSGNQDVGWHFKTVGWYITAELGSYEYEFYWEIPNPTRGSDYDETYEDEPLSDFVMTDDSGVTLEDWLESRYASTAGSITLTANADVVFVEYTESDAGNGNANDIAKAKAKPERHCTDKDSAYAKANSYGMKGSYFEDGYFDLDVKISAAYYRWTSANLDGVDGTSSNAMKLTESLATSSSYGNMTYVGFYNSNYSNSKIFATYFPLVTGDETYSAYLHVTVNDGYVLKSASDISALRTSGTSLAISGSSYSLSGGKIVYGSFNSKSAAVSGSNRPLTVIDSSPISLVIVAHTGNGSTWTSEKIGYGSLGSKSLSAASWTGSGSISVTDCISKDCEWYLDENLTYGASSLFSGASSGNFTPSKANTWSLYKSLVGSSGTYSTGTKRYWKWNGSSYSGSSTSDQGGASLSADGLTVTVNVYAKSATQTVTYKSGDGGTDIYGDPLCGTASGSMSDQLSLSLPLTLKSNAFSLTGYTFAGWTSKRSSTAYDDKATVTKTTWDGDDGADPASVGNHTMTLTAAWDPNVYTIRYNAGGADGGSMCSQEATYSEIGAGTASVWDCTYYWTDTSKEYTFLGWSTAPGGSVEISAGDTLTAALCAKIFGSGWKGSNCTGTLYAVWSVEASVLDLTKITGSLKYVLRIGGSDLESDGPYAYALTDGITLAQCMFGTRYEDATTIVKTYPTGILDGFEERDYLIPAGTSVYTADDWLGVGEPTLLRFMGWTVDPGATWADSQAVIWDELEDVSGEDLAYMQYSLSSPVKRNPEWDSYDASTGKPAPEPIAITLSDDAATRAQQLLSSAAAWEEYLGIPGTGDGRGGLVVQAYRAADTYYRRWCDQLAADRASEADAKSAMRALRKSDHNADVSSYSAAIASAEAAIAADQAKKDMYLSYRQDNYETAYAYSRDVSSVIADTRLYAAWDAYPDFTGMDEISINITEADAVTDEWLEQYAHALDVEDAEPGLTVSWSRDDIERLTGTGSVSVTFTATDSAGNATRYTTNLWILWDDQLQPDDPLERVSYETGYARFISRDFYEIGDPDSYASEDEYNALYRNATATNLEGVEVPYYMYSGGLNPNSLWYTDEDYKAAILTAFDNGDSDAAQETWHFTHEQVEASHDFVDAYGFGDLNGEGYLMEWWHQFAPECRTEG